MAVLARYHGLVTTGDPVVTVDPTRRRVTATIPVTRPARPAADPLGRAVLNLTTSGYPDQDIADLLAVPLPEVVETRQQMGLPAHQPEATVPEAA